MRHTAKSGGGGSQSFRRVSSDFPADLVSTSGMEVALLALSYIFGVGSLSVFGNFVVARGAHSPPPVVARGGASVGGFGVCVVG